MPPREGSKIHILHANFAKAQSLHEMTALIMCTMKNKRLSRHSLYALTMFNINYVFTD